MPTEEEIEEIIQYTLQRNFRQDFNDFDEQSRINAVQGLLLALLSMIQMGWKIERPESKEPNYEQH